MQQVYAAAYEWRDHDWQTVRAPGLYDPIDLRLPPDWADDAQVWVAGNALDALGESPGVLRTPDGSARHTLTLLPDAQSLLQLAPAAWARGEAVPAADLQPLYLRDKVALTTVEREAIKTRTAAAAASEVST
jgi:tRNA threonylcarbamoyladenosine biosynthesis protein TsaB